MKRLATPTYPDVTTLRNLAKNARLGSHPHLKNNLKNILAKYVTYRLVNGDPWTVPPLGIGDPLKKSLITHYNDPPKGLEYLERLRDSGSPDVCPMCGSLKSGTLDHVLPKTDYPEFAVFTLNLVPACDCNTLRREEYKGDAAGERVLHPYFDACLHQRLVHADFSGNLQHPDVTIKICCGPIPEYDTVKFHVETVVLKTRILQFLDAKWMQMIRQPSSVLMNIGNGPVIELNVRDVALNMLQLYDLQHGTPNNWFSIFYAGILHSPRVTHWLATRITGINNGTIVPT
jgi:hypothetical protein